MLTLRKYSPSIFSLILFFGMALTGSDKSHADDDSEGAKVATAWSEPITSLREDEDGVRILMRLPPFTLTDQSGEELASHDLYGHVWVANFIFTRCKASCPVQTALMNELQMGLKETENWKHTRIVSISVDPEYDTPEVLSKFIKERNLETSQWHFLTGTREAIWGLSKNGFKLPVADHAKDTEMPILHSEMMVLVDWEGRIRGYYNGADEEGLRDLKRDISSVTYERVIQPPDTDNPDWIESRMQKQLDSAADFDVFHDFKFRDETVNSGITFRHKLVDDAASAYKAVHYDHGNAVAVADVDLDGLYDIYFTSQTGSNELWRNLGNGQFENITDSAGLNLDDRIGVAASFGDIDNDGDPDLYITNVRAGNLLFENDGKGHFKDITQRSGTEIKAHSAGVTFFDYDRDGLLDLYVSNVGVFTTETVANVSVYTDRGQVVTDQKYYVGFKDAFAGHLKEERTENSVLFRNKGKNRFENVTQKVNLIDSSWSGDAVVVDGNNDGWPDLYVINMQGNDEYYENVEGKKFVRRSRELFPKTSFGSMGVTTFDYDNDGDMDIYVTDMHSDMAANFEVAKEKLKME
ncbi:MAG: FG-GAP-like repeat-containing protein, partial [Halioglobus sp.]